MILLCLFCCHWVISSLWNLMIYFLIFYRVATYAFIWLPQCDESNPGGSGWNQYVPTHSNTKQSQVMVCCPDYTHGTFSLSEVTAIPVKIEHIYLWVPHFQLSCRDSTTWQSSSTVVETMVTSRHAPLHQIWTVILNDFTCMSMVKQCWLDEVNHICNIKKSQLVFRKNL